ncbi:hypothetical protein BDQ17DRAFT_1251453, partial [Cyathus striatus]
ITTSGHWFASWHLAADATCHVFPHRRQELLRYHSYISNLFNSIRDPGLVIAFNHAVRSLISSRRDI